LESFCKAPGLFEYRRSLILLAGKGGVGKSMIALHIAHAVSNGQRIFDHYASEKCKVLIIDQENSLSVYKQRVELLGLNSLDNIDALILQGFRLNDPGHFEFLEENLNRKGYGLVIMNCWTNLVRGIDENKAGEVADILTKLRRLAYRYDATILLIHHLRKNLPYAVEEIDELRGSSVLVNEPDMVYLAYVEKMSGNRIIRRLKLGMAMK